jgi:hypothetical protein
MLYWGWLLNDMWDAWDDFDLSINWGNVATVTVAIAAIIVSSRFNVLTLRRSSAESRRRGLEFQQQRLDARNDKLRSEIAALVGALADRESLRNVMLPLAEAEIYARNVEKEAPSVAAKYMESFSGAERQAVFLKVIGHTYAIKMLTEDETIVRLADQVGQVVAADLGDIKRTLEIVKIYERSRSAARLYEDARVRVPERNEREDAMTSRVKELVDYSISVLRRL